MEKHNEGLAGLVHSQHAYTRVLGISGTRGGSETQLKQDHGLSSYADLLSSPGQLGLT